MPRHYPALIEPAMSGPGFGVLFPDFPGCVSAGATAELALANASEALQFHIEGMTSDGMAIPDPSPLTAPLPDWLGEADGVRALVPVEPADKPVRINVTLDASLLARVDHATDARHTSRSAFLADAARRAAGLGGCVSRRLSRWIGLMFIAEIKLIAGWLRRLQDILQ